MRIRHLSLDFFGHFTGKSFDFGSGDSGSDFHLIYGRNEAGKTTTMEAFLRLLYGFPHSEPYGFRHERKNLQISGTLDINGAPKRFVRLPSRNCALTDGNGNALPESSLQAHLGGLSLDDYRKLMCLDDRTIEEGGEEIANSKGDIGRLLFSAAAGVSDLTSVLDQVKERAEALHRKRASTTEMARLKKELVAVEREIKALDVSASTYRRLKQAQKVSKDTEQSERDARDALRRQETRNAAKCRALPVLREIEILEAQLDPQSHYPDRLEIDPEGLVTLSQRQSNASRDIERLTKDLADLTTQSDAIDLTPEHLTLAADLDEIEDLHTRHKTAEWDLSRRREELQAIVADMRSEARGLGLPDSMDPRLLVLPGNQVAQLDAVRDAMRLAVLERDTEQRQISELEIRLQDASARLKTLRSDTVPETDLAELLQRFSVETLAPKFAAAKQTVSSAKTQFLDALNLLSFRGQDFSEPPILACSLIEAEDLATRFSQMHQELLQLSRTLDEHSDDIVVTKAKITQITSIEGLVSDPDAKELMIERDALWAAHLRTLNIASADEFETAMRALDGANESRLTQANTLGQMRQLQLTLSEQEARAAQTLGKQSKLKAALREVEQSVNTLASGSGLSNPLSPPEFLEWTKRHEMARVAHQKLLQLQDQQRPVFEMIDTVVSMLKETLNLETTDFEALLAAARSRIALQKTAKDAQDAAEKELSDLQRELERRRGSLQHLTEATSVKADEWRSLVNNLLQDRVTADALEPSLDPLRTLRELDSARTSTERQVTGMETDQRIFAERVSRLAAEHDVPLTDDPSEVFKKLRALSGDAEAANQQRDALAKKHDDTSEKLQAAKDQLSETEEVIHELGRLFPPEIPTRTLAELREATSITQGVILARKRKTELVRSVLNDLDLPKLSDAKAVLAQATLSDLQAESTNIANDLEDQETRLRDAISARASAERDLLDVTGDADVAQLVEQKTTLELQLEEVALAYLQLSAGHRLAEEAIRRYRDTHRSSMMSTTEDIFSQLTNGAYTKLRTLPEGQSEVLQALDSAGTPKKAPDMSKGTRFQLYLALRAAAYSEMVSQGIHLPFFCDDIFETFDEDRTRAACRVMERIGQNGQAIYLTHHRHVVDLAHEVCDVPPVLHELSD